MNIVGPALVGLLVAAPAAAQVPGGAFGFGDEDINDYAGGVIQPLTANVEAALYLVCGSFLHAEARPYVFKAELKRWEMTAILSFLVLAGLVAFALGVLTSFIALASKRQRKLMSRISLSSLVAGTFLIVAFGVLHPEASETAASVETDADQVAAENVSREIEADLTSSEKADCGEDLACIYEEHKIAATIACDREIERLANYSSRWTNAWYEDRYSSLSWLSKPNKSIRLFGDKIQFQNGFGAWQNHIYMCLYDFERAVVLGVEAESGRL